MSTIDTRPRPTPATGYPSAPKPPRRPWTLEVVIGALWLFALAAIVGGVAVSLSTGHPNPDAQYLGEPETIGQTWLPLAFGMASAVPLALAALLVSGFAALLVRIERAAR